MKVQTKIKVQHTNAEYHLTGHVVEVDPILIAELQRAAKVLDDLGFTVSLWTDLQLGEKIFVDL